MFVYTIRDVGSGVGALIVLLLIGNVLPYLALILGTVWLALFVYHLRKIHLQRRQQTGTHR